MIDDVSMQNVRGQESPNIDRINQSGWDSSQDESVHTPGTPSHLQKFSYIHHGISLPVIPQPSPKQHQNTPSPHHPRAEQPPSIPPKKGRAAIDRVPALHKASTLPPQKDYPVYEDSAESSESEEESEFTKALKMGKANLANSPATRKRSSTMPLRPRNMTRYGHPSNGGQESSPSTGARFPQKVSSSVKQPLAAAIMRKIDSIQMDDPERSTDSEDSFGKTPPMRPRSNSQSSRKEKVAPPAPKPKPQVRRANTVVDPSSAAAEDEVSCGNHKARFEELSAQYGGSVQGNNSFARAESNGDRNSGQVDWKMALRPVKKTESGRASTRNRNRSGSNPSNPSPRMARPGSGDAVLNNHTRYDIEPDHLPPPLPAAVNNHLSIDFLNLPPPADFVSVPGAETGETSIDDIIHHGIFPPPSHESSCRDSPSPPPPPPPDSSPPREPLSHANFTGVRFPPRTEPTGRSTQEEGGIKVPSPMPSPMYPSSFDADEEAAVISPPQQFLHDKGKHVNTSSTPPGFEIPTPPSKGVAANRDGSKTQPDLDEAIRQLQLLSGDLTMAQSKGISSSGHQCDVTVTQPGVPVPNNLEAKSAAAVESPVFTPSVRSRSSTSSSNVSSLARYDMYMYT